jgi:hypothetical protein
MSLENSDGTKLSSSEKIKIKKDDKKSNDWKLELGALNGFCLSGVIFILSGIENKDILTIAGSAVWIISCIVWMLPYRKYFKPRD